MPAASWGLALRPPLRGDAVRALVRARSQLGALSGLASRWCCGDATAPERLAAAVNGGDVVFHLAGLRRAAEAGRLLPGQRRIDALLLDACAAGAPGLRRFVLAGSRAAAAPSATGCREEEPFAPRSGTGSRRRRRSG